MFWPTSSRRSFQFMHATWQALQPMHLDSSISLATCGDERTCDEGVVVAERATTFWALFPGMALSSGLLDIDEKRLELRRLRVGVADVWSQSIGQIAVLRHTLEAPVDGDAHHVHRLAVHLPRLDALGDHTGSDHLAAVGLHPHLVALLDALLLGQL